MEKIDALYVRVSTAQQKKKESPETQRSRLLEYAKDKKLNPRVYLDDGYSAKDTNRPAFKRMLADVKAGKVQSVVVTKLDRLSRNVQDAIELIYNVFEEHKVSLRALDQQLDTSTPMGRLMINLLVTVAQWEREMTSERVRIDMHHRAGKGKWCGGPCPYGYASHSALFRQYQENGLTKEEALLKAGAICPQEKLLYPHLEHALIVRQKMFEKYIDTKSLRAVTHALNNEGCKTPRGTTWATSSISRILRNPVYIGKVVYGKREAAKNNKLKKRPEEEWVKADGIHTPIIDEATFKKVQEILKSQARVPVRHASEYLLSGFLHCGKCGGKMHGYHYERNGNAWSYYRCTNHTHKGNTVCKGNSIDRDKIEKAIIDKLHQIHESEELAELERSITIFNKKVGKQDDSLKKEKEHLIKENQKLLQRKKVLIAKLSNQTIADEDFKLAAKELDDTFHNNSSRIQTIDDKLNDLGIQEVSFETVYANLNDFPRRWKHSDFQGRRTLLLGLVKSVKYLDPNTKVDLEIYCLKKKSKASPIVTCLQRGTGSSKLPKESGKEKWSAFWRGK